jgi:hypothetical protein
MAAFAELAARVTLGGRPFALRRGTTQLGCYSLYLQTEAPAFNPLRPGFFLPLPHARWSPLTQENSFSQRAATGRRGGPLRRDLVGGRP